MTKVFRAFLSVLAVYCSTLFLCALPVAVASEDIELIFQWRAVEGAEKYVIEISEAADFQEPLIIDGPSKTEYFWKTNLTKKVYWRVAADGKRKGLFSEPQALDIADLIKNPEAYQAQGVSLREPVLAPEPEPAPPTPPPAVTEPPPQAEVALKEDPELDTDIALPFRLIFLAGGGLHNFKLLGSDFEAKTTGTLPVALRAGMVVPMSTARSLLLETEWSRFQLTPEPVTKYPFQGSMTASQARLRLMMGSETGPSYGLSYRSVLRPSRKGPEEIEFANLSLFGVGFGFRRSIKTIELELLGGIHFGERLSQLDGTLRATAPLITLSGWSIVSSLQLDADLQMHPEVRVETSQVFRAVLSLGILFGEDR